MPIIDRQRRLHETGRIRIGEAVPDVSKAGKPIRRPKKLDAFRFTSSSRAAIDAVASLYGGDVHPWTEGAPSPGQFEVFTRSTSIEVVVPPEHLAFSQYYELWKGGGCERRCDGVALVPTGEMCLCDAEERECKPHTWLSLLLPSLLGSGLWRLDTQGEYAANELAGAFEFAELLHEATGRALLPGRLVLTQRRIKRPGQPARDFAVPVLELDANLHALVAPVSAGLPPGAPMAPPTLNGASTAALGAPAAPPAGLTPIPIDPEDLPPTVGEALAATEAGPPPSRRRTAEPIKATGRKSRARGTATTDEAPATAVGVEEPEEAPAADERAETRENADNPAEAREPDAPPATNPLDAGKLPTEPEPTERPQVPMLDQQRRAIFKILRSRLNVAEENRHAYVSEALGGDRKITSFDELSFDDAAELIEELNRRWQTESRGGF